MALSPISRAWLTAGAELGIRVEAPAVVVLRGALVECAAYLPDFGSANGAAAFARSAKPELAKRQDGDPFRSVLDDDFYGEFDRELFTATLDDWGWFGEGQPPAWYTGKPWTE